MFTVRQGEDLAFIHSHSYATKVGVSPSFEDIARHFGTAPPNVNGMIKTLERRGLSIRSPVHEALVLLGVDEHRAAEVSRRISAERARWADDGVRHRRSAARR